MHKAKPRICRKRSTATWVSGVTNSNGMIDKESLGGDSSKVFQSRRIVKPKGLLPIGQGVGGGTSCPGPGQRSRTSWKTMMPSFYTLIVGAMVAWTALAVVRDRGVLGVGQRSGFDCVSADRASILGELPLEVDDTWARVCRLWY